MPQDPQMDTEFTSSSTTSNPDSSSYASGGGMFAGSQNFAVGGGTFTNVTNNYTSAPDLPSDLRMIPLGDIDLQQEIRWDDDFVVVDRRRETARVRRVYSARVHGGNSNVTVAMYHGDGAEEEWRQDVARYMTVRHPNIIQICGAARWGNIYATLFHDDLIPFRNFLNLYRHSPILTVYIWAYCATEFRAVRDYFNCAFQRYLDDEDCTFWIRRSSGGLCTDLMQRSNITHFYPLYSRRGEKPLQRVVFLSTSSTEAAVIDGLTVEQYHETCLWNLSHSRSFLISNTMTVHLGKVISCGSSFRLEDSVEIASLANTLVHIRCWAPLRGTAGELTKDGWTRFDSGDISSNARIWLDIEDWKLEKRAWLSQADHIFGRLGITSNFEDYVLIDRITFDVEISAPTSTEDHPMGFLFLCPEKDLQTGPSSFRWPDCPAYWALDPLGVERLGTEEAIALGFPFLRLNIEIQGSSWDASVYAGLRQFHRAKGFDPESQDVARHLGHPFFQLSSEIDAPFAYVDDDESCEEECHQDPLNVNDSEDVPSSKSTTGYHKLSIYDSTAEPPSRRGEITKISQTVKLIIGALTLILFLALLWLYDQGLKSLRFLA